MPLFSRLHLATDRDQVTGREKGRTCQRRLSADRMGMVLFFFLVFWCGIAWDQSMLLNRKPRVGSTNYRSAEQSRAERQTRIMRQNTVTRQLQYDGRTGSQLCVVRSKARWVRLLRLV